MYIIFRSVFIFVFYICCCKQDKYTYTRTSLLSFSLYLSIFNKISIKPHAVEIIVSRSHARLVS